MAQCPRDLAALHRSAGGRSPRLRSPAHSLPSPQATTAQARRRGTPATTTAPKESEPAQLPNRSKPAHRARRAPPSVRARAPGGKVKVGSARAVGYLRPFVPGQHVPVKLLRRGRVIKKLNPKTKPVPGQERGALPVSLAGPGQAGQLPDSRQHPGNAQQAQRHRALAAIPDLLPGPRSGRPQRRRADLQPPAPP